MFLDFLLHFCCSRAAIIPAPPRYTLFPHQQEQELATIINRGPHQYQAQVRRKGYPTQTKTFETKKRAEEWATSVENEMNRGSFVDRSELEATTFGELLDRYAEEVTSAKRGRETEMVRIRALKKHALAARTLASLRSMDFANYRNERLKTCCPATVKRELVIISHVFTQASNEWSLPVGNPLAGVAKPREKDHRERRLRDDEESRLLQAADDSRAATLSFCITLAIETGIYRYKRDGREIKLGLGRYPIISLAEARRKAREEMKRREDGIAPQKARREKREQEKVARLNTFELVAREWHKASEKDRQWSANYAEKIIRYLELHVFPWMGRLAVEEIKPTEVVRCLHRIKERGNLETAMRVASASMSPTLEMRNSTANVSRMA